MKNLISLCLALSVLMFAAIGCGDKNRTEKTTERTKAAEDAGSTPKATPEPEIRITAAELTREYDKNELAADDKYQGKLLRVTGTVADVAETFGKLTVQLKGHSIVNNVMCSISESERAAAAKLEKGKTATVVGRGDGKTLGLYSGLKDCKVIE